MACLSHQEYTLLITYSIRLGEGSFALDPKPGCLAHHGLTP